MFGQTPKGVPACYKKIIYGLDCFTTSIRPLWRLQLPFRQGRSEFMFPKEWLSPCVVVVYVLWRYRVHRRAVYFVCLKQNYTRNCKNIFQYVTRLFGALYHVNTGLGRLKSVFETPGSNVGQCFVCPVLEIFPTVFLRKSILPFAKCP